MHEFLTSELDGSGWSASRPVRFILGDLVGDKGIDGTIILKWFLKCQLD